MVYARLHSGDCKLGWEHRTYIQLLCPYPVVACLYNHLSDFDPVTVVVHPVTDIRHSTPFGKTIRKI